MTEKKVEMRLMMREKDVTETWCIGCENDLELKLFIDFMRNILRGMLDIYILCATGLVCFICQICSILYIILS